MKILKLIFNTILFLLAVTAIFLTVFYLKSNKEKKELTDNERKGTTGRYIKLSQGITHYQLEGPDTGKVIILVHGFSVPYFIWNGTYEYLVKQGFRVLRYDMFGRGFSDRPDAVYNQSLYQTQLLDLIKQLHLKTPVSLAGVSFGGGVITNFTCKYPGMVDKVILIDPIYPSKQPTEPQFYTKYYEATHGDERANGQLADFKYPQRHPDWVKKYSVQMQYKGFRNAIVSTEYNYNYKGRESNICLNSKHKQVLLIWGKEDHTVPFTYSDSVRSVLKADFFPVDDAAHLPYIEQADKVNAKILDFLRKSDGLKVDSLKKNNINGKNVLHQKIVFKVYNIDERTSGDDCVFTDKYTVRQLLKRYPFSKTVKVVAVSFEYPDPAQSKQINDTTFLSDLHVKNGLLNYSSLIEIKKLNPEQINKLTNIIYNTTFRKLNDKNFGEAACFNPHNALVFYDHKGKIFDYLKICFECDRYESSSNKITIGTECNQKYDLLKSFFIELGIKYGTIQKD